MASRIDSIVRTEDRDAALAAMAAAGIGGGYSVPLNASGLYGDAATHWGQSGVYSDEQTAAYLGVEPSLTGHHYCQKVNARLPAQQTLTATDVPELQDDVGAAVSFDAFAAALGLQRRSAY